MSRAYDGWGPPVRPDPWDEHLRRLIWLYGRKRAEAILEETDKATAADLAAWRTLGSPK